MARVTVEDCVVKIANRFELVLLAAHRARALSAGEPLTMDRDNDKNPVVALREVAEETIDLDKLSQSVIQGLQKHVEVDEPEEDTLSLSMPTLELAEGESGQAEANAIDAAAEGPAEDAEQVGESDSDQESDEA